MPSGDLPTHQSRSRATRQKIVQALETLLKSKPFDQLSVVEIAAEAGVAVGTVYQRFKNKEALLPVLLEIYQGRIEQWMQKDGRIELGEDDTLHTALRKVFRKSWTIFRREAHLLRAVHLHVRMNPELADDEPWQEFERLSSESIRQLIGLFAAEVKRTDMATYSAFSAYFFNAIMIEKGLYGDEPPGTLFKPKGNRFADQCADMLYGYLTTKD
jgi:AcrR family transcriptional regulator